MAQVVNFFKNDVEFTEGPFVIASFGGRYRIESELPEWGCPVIPSSSVVKLLEREYGHKSGWRHYTDQAPIVDALNGMVQQGRIALVDGVYKVVGGNYG